ncbi:rna-binding [Trichoderma cornu-damae]|uniref:Rna-binding n=1 Tax=Trichoderma cornu-damae TaxID=654480 RepID=A0A9P8TXJ5_9HYPO|nr:rna-binding [Trichoderma cornu-damae]
MSHPPPPGTNLPARPPVSNSRPGFRSSFNPSNQPAAPPPYSNANSARANAPSYPAAPTTARYGSSYPSYPSHPPAVGMNHSASAYSYPQQHQHHQQHHPQQHQQQAQSYSHHAYAQPQSYQSQPYQSQPYQAAPRIQNPFPTPGAAAGSDYDPDMAAQIAQWQSAYAPRETDKDGKPVPALEYAKPEVVDATAAAAAAQLDKKKTVVREGGGKKWTDDTLLEWDPSHLRLFVGNLAGETTDESLLKAFARWKSVQKARVIRDKRTTKSKGYGFVSFSDADDFFQAAKEMHGKYIQSHPVVVKKANTEIKATNVKNKPHGGKKKGGNQSSNSGRNDSGAGGFEPHLGPRPGAGIAKSGHKTKNGLRLLG